MKDNDFLVAEEVTAMTYENGKQYKGVYGGVSVTFRLVNFTEKTVDCFNATLAEKALEHMKKEEKTV